MVEFYFLAGIYLACVPRHFAEVTRADDSLDRLLLINESHSLRRTAPLVEQLQTR